MLYRLILRKLASIYCLIQICLTVSSISEGAYSIQACSLTSFKFGLWTAFIDLLVGIWLYFLFVLGVFPFLIGLRIVLVRYYSRCAAFIWLLCLSFFVLLSFVFVFGFMFRVFVVLTIVFFVFGGPLCDHGPSLC